ncbi:MAG: Lrp/AsnC family transcriptional regulator [Opitutae bacterium]|nr:Lrp/AsnC family transcriptional regulator [Opitutae bacterium]MCD8298216.1 Lrp/AsnC family transcriptional regulator [Opitutae bacterium]
MQDIKEKVLKLILEGEKLSTEQMARILELTPAEVEAQIARLKEEKILLGWRPVFNPSFEEEARVRAVIELKISPDASGGFDRIAERISQFDQVEGCYLMSGSYDLLVIVNADNLYKVANFVHNRLARIAGVLSTATHFMLRAYKESGFAVAAPEKPERPAISQ